MQLLTADVASLARSVKESVKGHDRILQEHDRIIAGHADLIGELAQSVKKHDLVLRGHADLIGDLVKVATAHEHRIERLEGRQG